MYRNTSSMHSTIPSLHIMDRNRQMVPAQVTIYNVSTNTDYDALVSTLILASKDLLDVQLLDGESISQLQTFRSSKRAGLKTAVAYCKSWDAAMDLCTLMKDLHNSDGTPLTLGIRSMASGVGSSTRNPDSNSFHPERQSKVWNNSGEDLDDYEMNKYHGRGLGYRLPSVLSADHSAELLQTKSHKPHLQTLQRHQTELQAQMEFLELTRHMRSLASPPSFSEAILSSMAESSSPLSSSVTSSTYATSTSPPSPSTTRGRRDNNPPCNTLYVGNLPKHPNEHELRSLFIKHPGQRRFSLTIKASGPVCFVEFETITYATIALHALRGCALSNSTRGALRLSFARNSFGLRWNIDCCVPNY